MSRVDYQILRKNDLQGAISCIESSFFSGEPLFKTLSMTTEEFRSVIELIGNRIVENGLSVVAKDGRAGEIIGCVICKDFVAELLQGTEYVPPKWYPLLHLLETLDKKYKAEHLVKQGALLHLLMVGVVKPFTNRGIGRHLVLEAHRLAQEYHFKNVILEATGAISQYIFLNRLGYEEIDAISYQHFEYEGRKVFSSITECESCQLLRSPNFS
jgi:ribosomal protein S18 acetylase RimI-like enzyme